MTSTRGTSVDIPTQDGTADAYLAYPDDGSPTPRFCSTWTPSVCART